MGVCRARNRRRRRLTTLVVAILASASIAAKSPQLSSPTVITDGIVINIPQRLLVVMRDGIVAARYPVAVGLPTWQTFVGPFTVVAKETDPVWDVPVSVQEEMRLAGKKVITRVPPGPNNPLGKFWLGLSEPGFGIHGTNAPKTVGSFATHGCIRMRPADIAALYASVTVGTPGEMVYEPVLVGGDENGLWLEAHPDAYGLETRDALALVMSESARLAPTLTVDVELVRRVLAARDHGVHRIDVFSTP